jgi:hypothetical protein
MSRLSKVLILILSGVSLAGFSLDNQAIEVKVSKNEVSTGEIFSYDIAVEGNFSEPRLTLPKFKGLRIASQSHAKSYSFEEGKRKTIIKLGYHLFAPEPGEYTIEPVILNDGQNQHQSESITIKARGQSLSKQKKLLPFIRKGTEL